MNKVWGLPNSEFSNLSYEILEEIREYAFHSVCHLYSGILIDSTIFKKEYILDLAVDGGPDGILDNGYLKKKQFCGVIFEKGKGIKFAPIESPGLLYETVANRFKLREGTLMALATASESELINPKFQVPEMFNTRDIPNINCSLEKLVQYVEKIKPTDQGILYNYMETRFSAFENKVSMIMKGVQKCSIRIMERNIETLLDVSPYKAEEMYLSITGGYALNCPTNTYLMNRYHFKGFLAPPCTSDTGISLGLALYIFSHNLNGIEFSLESAYYGDEDKGDWLNDYERYGYKEYIYSIQPLDYTQAIKDLMNEPIIWFKSRAEIGPRALGHRSILCDPRNIQSKNKVNMIKQRQWWRPVAPIILEEYIEDWFQENYRSPYMLHAFKIREDKAARVRAVLHLDNTARVQTVDNHSNCNLYNFILEFLNKTGIPMVGNTSLNDKGEPIINSIPQVINFALRKRIKVMYINGKRVKLHNHNSYLDMTPLKRDEHIWVKNYIDKEKLMKKIIPYL